MKRSCWAINFIIYGKHANDSFDKAKLLSKQFHSVFTNENLSNILNIDHPSYPTMPDFSFSTKSDNKLLSRLTISKSPGLDGISPIRNS